MEKLGESCETQSPHSTLGSDCLGDGSTLGASTSSSEVSGALPVVLEHPSDVCACVYIMVRTHRRINSSRLAACGL